MLNKFVFAAIASLFAVGMAHAQASGSCESQAVSKTGKPLTGAAKTSFIKKCQANAMKSAKGACETKAVGSNGKPLTGAAKTSFMKKCEADAAK